MCRLLMLILVGAVSCLVMMSSLPFYVSCRCVPLPDGSGAYSQGLVHELIEVLGAIAIEKKVINMSNPQSELGESLNEIIDRSMTTDISPSVLEDLLNDVERIGINIEWINNKTNSRQKRGILPSQDTRWTNGIVPYKFSEGLYNDDKIEIRRAQLTYERLTCIRFVHWSENDGLSTNQRLGLDHKSYLKHVERGEKGCYSYIGRMNYNNAHLSNFTDGQPISCCSGYTCVHEYGHALGLHHEQNSKSSDRKLMIRINKENINLDKIGNFNTTHEEDSDMLGYDISSFMHYQDWMYSNGLGRTYTRLYPEIKERNNLHYMMMMVSLGYECEERNCSHISMKCENDGYMTLVDGKCQCKCVDGLDPDTGCTSIMSTDRSTQQWPGGSYALPEPVQGCAYTTHWTTPETNNLFTNGVNTLSNQLLYKGVVARGKVEQHFCVTVNSTSTDIWPTGNYCIYRKGGKCPQNFEDGSVTLQTFYSNNLPDQTMITSIHYCCRYNGFTDVPIFLPNKAPFMLIRLQGVRCQEVRNMHVYEETLSNRNGRIIHYTGLQPLIMTSQNEYTTTFCSYIPANMNCGGYYELNKTNPSVEFSSPQGNDLECIWFVKSPKHENIRLSFDNFNVDCKDTLEIRYFRIGQKGFNFCGNKLDRTIQSINNTMMVRLSTGKTSNSSFKATVTLSLDEDLCYDVADRGMTYAGLVNFTRFFEPCLPWAEVQHCKYNPYKYMKSDGNLMLEGNYCRNPDYTTGLLPWCYTDKSECQRNYCDPCLFGTRYDTVDDCEEKAAAGLCHNSELKSEALSKCAKTCNIRLPSKPPKAKDVKCFEPPERVFDGSIVAGSKNGKGMYSVGSVVTYKCDVHNTTNDRVCLTSGQWSKMGFVCDPDETICRDMWDACALLFVINPGMCTDKEFAKRTCPYTCGFCNSGSTPACEVAPPSANAITYFGYFGGNDTVMINSDSNSTQGPLSANATVITNSDSNSKRGTVIEYICKKGYVPYCGDIKRGCDAKGQLTGMSLQCIEECPQEWEYSESSKSCIRHFNEWKTHDNAMLACKSLGGYLAMPKTSQEQAVLVKAGLNGWTWIGLTDKIKEGEFVWDDNEPLEWDNWLVKHPNTMTRKKDCAAIHPTKAGFWVDENCNSIFFYSCQVPVKVLNNETMSCH